MDAAFFIIFIVVFGLCCGLSNAGEKSAGGFAGGAAIGAVAGAVSAGGIQLVASWLSQNPWGWLLLIGFIVVAGCVWFVLGVTGLLVRLLYRD